MDLPQKHGYEWVQYDVELQTSRVFSNWMTVVRSCLKTKVCLFMVVIRWDDKICGLLSVGDGAGRYWACCIQDSMVVF